MNRQKFTGSILLLIGAIIWGVAFVAQAKASNIGAFTFNCVRNIIGGVVLLPLVFVLRKKGNDATRPKKCPNIFICGAICGFFLAIASAFQQSAINMGASTGKAGFITACYIIFVPLISTLFGKRVSPLLWIAVALSTAGLYLLCMTESLVLEISDLLLLACAVSFAFQILAIDRFSPYFSGIKLASVQFFACGFFSGIMMLIFEKPSLSAIYSAAVPILYTGVFSSGVAYTLQIVGQKKLNPTVATLIMSLESAIAAISGWLILGQSMRPEEIIGCVIMFAAIVIAQLPTEIFKRK
ncbi:MAG: DMT family transporter [Clostridia bacterium]|nr:DMT family transporter [Clostridia bacterium]